MRMRIERVCESETCGEKFLTYPYSIARGGGRFCKKCVRRGPHNSQWKGGRRMHKAGYVLRWVPNHPHADHGGYVLEHRLVAERVRGITLPREAVVHHVNEIKDDNRPSNLVICPNDGYHRHLHQRMRVLAAGGDPRIHLLCGICKTPKLFDEFHKNRRNVSGRQSTCKLCANSLDAQRRLKKKRAQDGERTQVLER